MKKAQATVDIEYRVYPTPDQQKAIFKTLKACQFVYNHYLRKHIDDYKATGQSLGFYDCMTDFKSFKRENDWLREADSQALKFAIKELYTDFAHFFYAKRGYPQYKRNGCAERHYKTPANNGSIKISSYGIQLPKLGKVSAVDPNNFTFKQIEQPKSEIIAATITCKYNKQFFVVLHCKKPKEEMKSPD